MNAKAAVIAQNLPALAERLRALLARCEAMQSARRSILGLGAFTVGVWLATPHGSPVFPVLAIVYGATVALLAPAAMGNLGKNVSRLRNVSILIERLAREGSQMHEHASLSDDVKLDLATRLSDGEDALRAFKEAMPHEYAIASGWVKKGFRL